MSGIEEAPGAAVIVAAGSGTRIGFDKTLADLAGDPVICHSLRAFASCADVTEIVVVTARERVEAVCRIVSDLAVPVHVIEGGATRMDSVIAGLEAVSHAGAIAAVHDAARPLVTPELVARCFAAAREHGGSVAAERVIDSLQRGDAAGYCVEPVPREGLWRMQTPQVFPAALLLAAYREARADGLKSTDETTVMRRAGHPVFLVENSDWNFKVTVPRDLDVARYLVESRRIF